MGAMWDTVAGLILGSACASCGGAGTPVCQICLDAVAGPAYPTEPTPRPPGFPPTWAVGAYAGVLRDLLLAHKEHGRLALAGPLGRILAEAVRTAVDEHVGAQVDQYVGGQVQGRAGGWASGEAGQHIVPVPVPSSRRSVRVRGHDPMLRVARVTAAVLRREGRSVQVLPVLRHRRRVADQSGLDTAARKANLAGSLQVPGGLIGALPEGSLVVVDDVVTTGATLCEAARALAAAGAVAAARASKGSSIPSSAGPRALCAATLAATVRRAEPGATRRGGAMP